MKDIICLPKESDGLEILIPRGSSRSALAGKGLIGKLTLSSYMDEQEIRELICEVFQGAFGGDKQYPFKFLQCAGGGSKFLTKPCTTGTFKWNAKEIISAAGKGAIYIIAEKKMDTPCQVADSENEEDRSDQWR